MGPVWGFWDDKGVKKRCFWVAKGAKKRWKTHFLHILAQHGDNWTTCLDLRVTWYRLKAPWSLASPSSSNLLALYDLTPGLWPDARAVGPHLRACGPNNYLRAEDFFLTIKQTNNTKQNKQTTNNHYLVWRAKSPLFAKQDNYMSYSEGGQTSFFGSKIRFFGHFGVKMPLKNKQTNKQYQTKETNSK